MILNDDKEQNQNVEHKYLDPEMGIEIELKKERLYKIRKNRIIHPTKNKSKTDGSGGSIGSAESVFNKLDHRKTKDGFYLKEDFEENVFLTDNFLEDIIQETKEDREVYEEQEET